MLKAYECVPEAYRQRFRACRKEHKQSHLEFCWIWENILLVGILCLTLNIFMIWFNWWFIAVPDNIATYISEHKTNSPEQAAVLADDYVLTHWSSFVNWRSQVDHVNTRSSAFLNSLPPKPSHISMGKFDPHNHEITIVKRGTGKQIVKLSHLNQLVLWLLFPPMMKIVYRKKF